MGSGLSFSTTQRKRNFKKAFLADTEYRHAYAQEVFDQGIAFQLRAMRTSRNWTQAEVGERARMAQNRISELENPDYGRYSLNTLKKLAEAFDVVLFVHFGTFSDLAERQASLARDQMAVPSVEDDPNMREGEDSGREGASLIASVTVAPSTTDTLVQCPFPGVFEEEAGLIWLDSRRPSDATEYGLTSVISDMGMKYAY